MESRDQKLCPRCGHPMERHEAIEFNVTYSGDKYGKRSPGEPPSEKAPGWRCRTCGHTERATSS